MLNRRCYRLGLWIGGLAAPAARPRRLPAPVPPVAPRPDPRLESVADAVITCDALGAVTYVNTSARALFGPDGSGLSCLRYSSGQPVPAGQSPLTRTRLTGKSVEATGYVLPTWDGGACILDVTAQPWQGGATAVFRDVTVARQSQARETAASGKSQTLGTLGTRLGAATETGEIALAVVEGARKLSGDRPDVQARLYTYDAASKRLTRLASAPDDQPKRPRSHRQSRPETFPLNATDPMLWQVYVTKQPYSGPGTAALAEDDTFRIYALPLLAEGKAVGHLSLTFREPEAADDDTKHALGLLASLAALALSGLHEKAQASALAAQAEAVGEVARAVASGTELGALADLVMGHVCRLTEAEVCTLTVWEGEHMRLVGAAYRDDLTFPKRHAPGDALLGSECLQAALSSRKTTQRLGLTNPPLEAGPWRSFAGQSGRHSILSVPLPGGRGGWTVYWTGDAPLPADQVKFLETLALLTAATMSAGRTGP